MAAGAVQGLGFRVAGLEALEGLEGSEGLGGFRGFM